MLQSSLTVSCKLIINLSRNKLFSIAISYPRQFNVLRLCSHCDVSDFLLSRELKYILNSSLPKKAFSTLQMIIKLFILQIIVNSFMYKELETFVACVSAWNQIAIYKIHRGIEKTVRSKSKYIYIYKGTNDGFT